MKLRMNECNFLQNKLGNVTVINVLWYLFEAPGGAGGGRPKLQPSDQTLQEVLC